MTVKVGGDEGKHKTEKKIKQFRIVLDFSIMEGYSFYYSFIIPT